MRYPGMEFSKDEILANEIFTKLLKNSLEKEIPKDFM